MFQEQCSFNHGDFSNIACLLLLYDVNYSRAVASTVREKKAWTLKIRINPCAVLYSVNFVKKYTKQMALSICV